MGFSHGLIVAYFQKLNQSPLNADPRLRDEFRRRGRYNYFRESLYRLTHLTHDVKRAEVLMKRRHYEDVSLLLIRRDLPKLRMLHKELIKAMLG
mmetsp:Transcript_27112/g.65911  ORF Transcript_27112/g.65911 Transcript_27112/m.65911 type:complete len:94 (-) Transcript_27112:171-452(-)